uniref:Uncharacterized protein n=1 Tax=Glossina austeni TaxID=7395 RepID=A0A1A9UYI5_GLOAU
MSLMLPCERILWVKKYPSSIQLSKHGLTSTKLNVDHLQSQTNAINRDGQILPNEFYQLKVTQLFNAGIMQLSFLTTKPQKIQACILDALIDTHHGRRNPLLLTPIQLQNEIKQTKAHLPQSLKLPAAGAGLSQFYKLMTIKEGLSQTPLTTP